MLRLFNSCAPHNNAPVVKNAPVSVIPIRTPNNGAASGDDTNARMLVDILEGGGYMGQIDDRNSPNNVRKKIGA